MMNSKLCILDIKENLKLPPLMNLKLLEPLSIGFQQEKSKKLKIKDNVDLVGLSLLLPQVNHSKLSTEDLSEIFLNNNLLIVQHLTEIKDVMVV